MNKLVYGVGINDAGYVTKVQETVSYVAGRQKQRVVWRCPFYRTWEHMLERAYSAKLKLKRPTYKDVTVCGQWYKFSTFKAWMETQAWEGNHLDKDLLVPGNKIYSPETCIFVNSTVNGFLVDSSASRGAYKVGVSFHKRDHKFVAKCNNPFTQDYEYLGYFSTEQEAYEAWLTKKLEHARALAEVQTDIRAARALISRYENLRRECYGN